MQHWTTSYANLIGMFPGRGAAILFSRKIGSDLVGRMDFFEDE